MFLTGKKHEPNWISSGASSGFYELKAHLENVLERLGINPNHISAKPLDHITDLYSGGLCYMINNIPIAELAIIKKGILRQFDIKNDVFYSVIKWQNLIKARGDHNVQHKELPRFPEVRRDLALVVDKSLTYDRIRDLAYLTEDKLLTRVDLFDVYEGEQIAADKKSYAVSFILQDTEATLTDERIDRTIKRLMDAYAKELGAVIRK
jgi:phenylalanyl-tRNA synthetase beta chain